MDGETALWYTRSRYSTNDFDRGRRQQEVLLAIFEKLLSLDGIARAPELFNIYQQNVTTNLNFDAVLPLLPVAAQLNADKMARFSIGPGQVTSWVNSAGSQVLLPNREAVLQVMRQALNSP
jgi:anionic cell wall polymer biosynthesis LytR-Cps2A-Psr (LCP) family protein